MTHARNAIGPLLSIAVPAAIWFAPLGVNATARHALAVAAFMILAWIAPALPHALTGMVGCYLFWVLGVVPFRTAFSGFADQTAWFLFGAVLLGAMTTKSGLGRRLAYLVIRRTGTSYSRILLGMILTSFLLTFLVPSGIACVAIMAPVAMGLMEVLGIRRGGNPGRGIFVTLTYTAGCFDKTIIAGPAAILARGMIERQPTLRFPGVSGYWLSCPAPWSRFSLRGVWSRGCTSRRYWRRNGPWPFWRRSWGRWAGGPPRRRRRCCWRSWP
jgi:di/tricarboxylate transporter